MINFAKLSGKEGCKAGARILTLLINRALASSLLCEGNLHQCSGVRVNVWGHKVVVGP
jgi:hypothetical protein